MELEKEESPSKDQELAKEEQSPPKSRHKMTDKDTAAMLRGEFYLRSKAGQEALAELKRGSKDGNLKLKLILTQSSISFMNKKKNFVNPDTVGTEDHWENTHRVLKEGRMSKELQLTQLPIHGVDNEHKTIVIRIRLRKKKDDIITDIKSLLDALDWEAKFFKIDMRRPKPHLKFLSDALKVYDLHKEQKKSWKEIGLGTVK